MSNQYEIADEPQLIEAMNETERKQYVSAQRRLWRAETEILGARKFMASIRRRVRRRMRANAP